MKTELIQSAIAGLVAGATLLPVTFAPRAEAGISPFDVAMKTMEIDGLTIAYRGAGDPSKPALLQLHGFPTSSHMFRKLIPELAGDYHIIAPDYPGFGASDMPLAADYDYSVANTAETWPS